MGEGQWFIVRVLSGHEQKVRKRLESGAVVATDKIYEIMVPVEKVVEMRKEGQHIRERCKIPGYMFVKMETDHDLFRCVRGCDGVIGFLNVIDGEPQPVSEADISDMCVVGEGSGDGDVVSYSRVIKVGSKIRVVSGVFSNSTGEVLFDHGNGRLVVRLLVFGRDTRVELESWQVEQTSDEV